MPKQQQRKLMIIEENVDTDTPLATTQKEETKSAKQQSEKQPYAETIAHMTEILTKKSSPM